MNQRTLGNTGETVSELGLGTAFMRQSQDQSGVNNCVARAIDRGIGYFDTAADYGQGEDERALGEALLGRRQEIFLATKVGGVKDEGGHRNADSLMRQHEEGLKRLQTDRVDLIQIHECDQRKWWSDDPVPLDLAVSHGGPLIRDEENYDFAGSPCVEFLHRAKAEGKARFIGITGKDARRLERIVEALDLDSMMIAHQYNPILRNAARYLLPTTDAQNLGVAGGAMFLKGWLAVPQNQWRDNRPEWMNDAFHDAYFAYLDVQTASGIPLPDLTLRWIQAELRIHTIVTGFSDWDQVETNIDAIERGPLPTDLHDAIDDIGIIQPLHYQGRTEL
jgi:L-galactose dehydrogenase